MTLWSIARSPLIMGGDLRHLDRPTLDLLTNPEVIAVNQASYDNQPHFIADGVRVWSARIPGSADRYLALFNTDKRAKSVGIDLSLLGIIGEVRVRDLWAGHALPVARGSFAQALPAHGSGLYRLGA
jgi:alpha-galactosidase